MTLRAEVIHGDCLDVMRTLAPGSVGLALLDPPYGIKYQSHHNSGRRGPWARWVRDENFAPIDGDDVPFDPTQWLALDCPIAIFGGNYCADRLPASRCWIVWDKRAGIGSNDFADCELVWTNFDKPSRVFAHLWSGLIRAGEENVSRQPKYHPHQKPVDLARRIIAYAELPPGSLVVDGYCGSGSFGVAAVRDGYGYLGIDTDASHVAIARRRIAEAQAQGNLFGALP